MGPRNLRRAVSRAGLLGLGAGLGVALTALTALTACTTSNQPTPSADATPSPEISAEPTQAATPTEVAPPVVASPEVASPVVEAPSPEASPSPAAIVPVYWPQQIEIPSIKVKAPVVQIGLEPDGAMEAPNGPDIIGWYTGSVAPGVAGNALVTAHVDWLDRSTGKARTAVFWDINKLKKGDQVIVHAEENQKFTFLVKDSVLVKFDDPDALKYLEPTETPTLTMITCEGDFDQSSRNYDKRRIVLTELQ